MSTDTRLFSAVLDKIRHYFDAELSLQVTIEDLTNWLKTQSMCITTHKLQNILQEYSGEFSLTKASESNRTIVKLKKVVNLQEPQYKYTESDVRPFNIISEDLIDFSNNNVDKVIKNNSYVAENSLNLSNNGEQILLNHFNENLYKQNHTQRQPSPYQEQQQWQRLQNSKVNQINNDNDEAVKALKNYLDKFLIDSIHEVERYLKHSGVLKDREINEILFEDPDIFHVYKVKGITCVKLRSPAKIIDEHSLTMINNRIEQTENLIKEYIKKNYSENGVTGTELLIYLREVKGVISYEFKEFLENCSNSFNCYEDDGILFVANKSAVFEPNNNCSNGGDASTSNGSNGSNASSISGNSSSNSNISSINNNSDVNNDSISNNSNGSIKNGSIKYRSSKEYIFQLICEYIMKECIVTLSELENYLKSYSQLTVSNSKQLIYSHEKDLNIKEISGEIYICFKLTDHNILCHVRRYLLEYGRVQLSLIGDYLKRLDFSPKFRLKEFLSSSPDYVFSSESTSTFIKSKEIEIVRSIRELFKNDKRIVALSVISDYLNKSTNYPRSKVMSLLENYVEFDFYLDSKGIMVVHRLSKFDPKPKELIRKLIIYGNGKVKLSTLNAHLNWNGNYSEYKLLDLIRKSDEFQQINNYYRGKYSEILITFKPNNHNYNSYNNNNSNNKSRSINLMVDNKDQIDFINSTKKLIPQKNSNIQKNNSIPASLQTKTEVSKTMNSTVNNEFSSNSVENYQNPTNLNNSNNYITENSELPDFNKFNVSQVSLTKSVEFNRQNQISSLKSSLAKIPDYNNYHINDTDSSESLQSYTADKIITQVDSNDVKEILREFLINQEKQLFSSFKTIESWKDYSETNLKNHQVEIKTRDEEIKRCHQEIEGLEKTIAKLQMENDNLRHYDMNGFYYN